MAKIRIIRPELFLDEELFEIEKAHQLPLRLAFTALFTCCDREGPFNWQPKRLKLATLPYDELDMSAVLNVLASHGFIIPYQIDQACYGCIASWDRYQLISPRETASNIPPLQPHLQVEPPLSQNISKHSTATHSVTEKGLVACQNSFSEDSISQRRDKAGVESQTASSSCLKDLFVSHKISY